MFISTSQLLISVERLEGLHPFFGYAFLAFKKMRLPVGSQTPFHYSKIKELVLERSFRPVPQFDGYFNPFKSNKRWVNSRYESTSLQRVIADTFGEAFERDKGSSLWGWKDDYVSILRKVMEKTGTSLIPLLDLAVWIYREDPDIPSGHDASAYLLDKLTVEFDIDDVELKSLCMRQNLRLISLAAEPPNLDELFNLVGWPEGVSSSGGVSLEYLYLQEVGPTKSLEYMPRPRLNILTGDNSLGKTFLLDCAWWAVCGHWPRYPAEPRRSESAGYSEIAYGLEDRMGRTWRGEAAYDRFEESWQRPPGSQDGLAIYATHSGSIAVWDPIQQSMSSKSAGLWTSHLVFSREEVWEGLSRIDMHGRKVQLCNGLINDWATWQLSGERHSAILQMFENCLKELSPNDGPFLRSGKLSHILGDSRDFPTIRMPYGEVPIIYASAGVQRMLGIIYMLVWHWEQHVARSKQASKDTLTKIVFIVDEIDAHLHPRWQRQVLPALLSAVQQINPNLSFQFHISTHAPLVLASSEPVFKLETDCIHHITLENDSVILTEIQEHKHGTSDAWLESEVFGLSSARSREAETLIERAKIVQENKDPSPERVSKIHDELIKLLSEDDEFWVRWNYFRQTIVHGIEKRK